MIMKKHIFKSKYCLEINNSINHNTSYLYHDLKQEINIG